MPNQKKGKSTPKSTPSKATPKESPKTRGVGKATTPNKKGSPKAAQKQTTPQRESRSSTPSKVVAESPKAPTQKKTATPKTSPKGVSKQAKVSPKGKASPKSTKSTPKKVASPKNRKYVESDESESEDENTEFKVGDLIDAQWEDGLFYSAKIFKVNKLKSGTTYNVEFIQDKVSATNLKRSQIQSYTDDSEVSEEEVSHKHKTSNDDLEYVEGDIPLRYGDESVESDSTEQPRAKKAGRKPANKRKREAPVAPSPDKRKKLAASLVDLDEKQLINVLKKACSSNVEILEAVEAQIADIQPKKPAPKPKVATKKAAEKKAPKATTKATTKAATTKTVPKKGGKAAAPQKSVGRRSSARK